MPDGDVFDRHGKRGWKKASRLILSVGDLEDGVPSALRALGKELKESGCPGINQIVATVVSVIQAGARTESRKRAVESLEQIRVQNGSSPTEIAVNSGLRQIAEAFELDRSMLQSSEGSLRAEIASCILADLADARLCPQAVLAGVIEEERVSYQVAQARRQGAKEAIASAPEMRRMAIQLLVDPSGAVVRSPQFRREKLAQSQILVTPLTS